MQILIKKRIILDNKNKASVYQFINLLTGAFYVGSSTNLSKRFRQYYNYSYISSPIRGKSIIYSSIISNGYSSFSLIIIEYCEINDTINREQFYIDVIKPKMNILQTAGSLLGYKHTPEALAKLSEIMTGKNYPMYGQSHTPDTLAKMSATRGTAIYVYSEDSTLVNIFSSSRKTAVFLECSQPAILTYIKTSLRDGPLTGPGKLFKNKRVLSTSKK